jgi:hypothetical protein
MDEFKKEDVKMPSQETEKDLGEISSKIVMPGMSSGEGKENAKPLIMEQESDKYTPNHTIEHVSEDGLDKVVFVFQVPEETSAKNIDMDVSSKQIKLTSQK